MAKYVNMGLIWHMGVINPPIYSTDALLPNTTEATYTEMLKEVKYLTNNVDPQTIMTDFERAAINASNVVYPNTEHSGCLFHLSQSIYRRIQREGLQVQYNNNVNDLQKNLRMLAALVWRANVWRGIVSRGIVSGGNVSRENCLRGNCPGGNCLMENCLWGQLSEGELTEGN